jgi:molybdate transport system ATP-binding protein
MAKIVMLNNTNHHQVMLKWENVSVKIRTSVLLKNIDLEIRKGESFGITGCNGSGKTVMAKAIAGLLPVSGEITDSDVFAKKTFVPFHSSLTLSNGQAVYRQQRWNKIDTELLPVVKNELAKCENPELVAELVKTFGLDNLTDSFVINLSNGEQRKLELIKALAGEPNLLVLDNAYTGLDTASRNLLTQMLEKLITSGHTLIMTGLTASDFPPSVSKFIVLKNGHSEGVFSIPVQEEIQDFPTIKEQKLPHWKNSSFQELIYLNDVSLEYGSRKILNGVNWEVKAGEHWSLTGPNGSGKTSLLNLIFGDNPKAYGCNIRLFGRQKGSGESIWDIKARIGFVSPEMHQYLPQKQSVIDVICSGFQDADSSFKKPTGYQVDVARQCLKLTGYSETAGRLFGELSTSAQRVVLFLRTLVKNPPLLILDEPFQGLDTSHVRMLKNLLNLIAANTACSMIFVTHIPDELPECITKHLKLKDGLVV